jgi:hypothetical protein
MMKSRGRQESLGQVLPKMIKAAWDSHSWLYFDAIVALMAGAAALF